MSQSWLKIRLHRQTGVSQFKYFKMIVHDMLIFWEQRLVFLATPKAGSTAIEAALEPLASVNMKRPHALKHMTARNYHQFMAPYLRTVTGEDFTTIALMREPQSWLASWYRFHLRDAETDTPPPFETFIQNYTDDTNAAHIGTQSAILCDIAGNKSVDRIFRYEDMEKFVTFLEDRLNCAITLPRINVPPETDTALAAKNVDMLRTKLAVDYALYDQLAG